jgi:hypothetical protein
MQAIYPFLVLAARIGLPLLIVVEVYLSLVPLGGTPRFEHADKVAHLSFKYKNL